MIQSADEPLRCPDCKRLLLQSFNRKTSFYFAVSPQTHHCRDCAIAIISWVIITYPQKLAGNRSIPFNGALDESILNHRRRHHKVNEERLVVTERAFRDYTKNLKDDSVDAILRIYFAEKRRNEVN